MHAEFAHAVLEGGIRSADGGQRHALRGDRRCQMQIVHQQARDFLRADFIELIENADGPHHIFDAHAAVEALQHLAIVDVHGHRPDVQALQDFVDDDRQLGIEVERDFAHIEHIEIALVELAEAALLRAFAAPGAWIW